MTFHKTPLSSLADAVNRATGKNRVKASRLKRGAHFRRVRDPEAYAAAKAENIALAKKHNFPPYKKKLHGLQLKTNRKVTLPKLKCLEGDPQTDGD
tara:strand:+ start:638 stop:925 length:288 start_codon:yes stop_codon:yes gene_type:complete